MITETTLNLLKAEAGNIAKNTPQILEFSQHDFANLIDQLSLRYRKEVETMMGNIVKKNERGTTDAILKSHAALTTIAATAALYAQKINDAVEADGLTIVTSYDPNGRKMQNLVKK